MTSTHPRARLGAFTFLILLMAFVAGTGTRFQASAEIIDASGGLANPGFDRALPSPWNFSLGADFAGVVAGPEDMGDFAAYGGTPDGDVKVDAKTLPNMARLGTPKALNSSQPTGMNSVSQTFTPTTGTVSFSAWLFSWEHRGNDIVSFAFTDAQGGPVGTFAPAEFKKQRDGATVVSCGSTVPAPCIKTIDVGNRGEYLNSGWVTVTVTNLPTDGLVTFKASVGSTANNAHASWLYLDEWVNSPPVAAFAFVYPKLALTPGGTPQGPVEGIAVGLRDYTSSDPDPGDSVVAWKWVIKGPGLPELGITSHSQNPFFMPQYDGEYHVWLTVTDTFGETHSSDKPLLVLNAPPLVNVPNMEVLKDTAFTVEGRFSDGGWHDRHTASWSPGLSPAATNPLGEDNKAMLSSGIARATGTFATSGAGTLTVTDNGGASGSDSFDIKVVDPTVTTRYEPNDAITGAPELTIDGSYLSFIQAAGDKDVYEIRWPGGLTGGAKLLPAGAEVLVTLKELPADYDLILVSVPEQAQPAGYEFSGFEFSGSQLNELPNMTPTGYEFSGYEFSGYEFSSISRTGYEFSGYEFSGYEFSGYEFSGYEFSAYEFSGYEFSGYEFSGYEFSPISQMGYTNLDASSTSPSDISLGQLGLGTLPAGATVVSYSANRGTAIEAVLARVDVPGTKLYAIIVGSNAAHSEKPYRLQVEGSVSMVAAALAADSDPDPLGAKNVVLGDSCKPVTPPDAASFGVTDFGVGARTLFVVNPARLNAKGPAEWSTFVTSMNLLAQDEGVKGKFLNLNSSAAINDAYGQLDASPCDVDKANAVASAVRDAVQAALTDNTTISYVVILGDDDVVPYRRVPDETTISNERYYLASSFLKPGTPLYASVSGGFNLTDDCYVDAQPTPWQGRELCIPDLVVSRMVETPLEIAAQADAFTGADGLLNMTSGKAFVSGYDFFDDGSTAVSDALALIYPLVGNLIGENWTADQLRCKLGIPASCGSAPTVSDVNAHFTHYAGLSAAGFKTGANSDVLKSTDIGAGTFIGRLIFTIGCHAGFSMPGSSASAADPALGINTALDFAQAFAQERAVFVASTGFGLGDNAGIGGTEKLLVYYAEELAKNNGSIGQALVNAKRRYLSSLTAASVYDEKSSINLTIYGLPMYHRPDVTVAEPNLLMVSVEALSGAPIAVSGPHSVTGVGKYYAAVGGDASAPPYRPLQPRFTESLPPVATEGSVHGVLWTGGSFKQVGSVTTSTYPFDPVIVRPQTEWEAAVQEPQVCHRSFWPSELFRVNTLNGRNGLEQTLVVTPGQFRCDGLDTSGKVFGTQRIFDNLTYAALRSLSADVTSPDIFSVSSSPSAVDGNVTLDISASDPVIGSVVTGVARIVVLRVTETSAANPDGTVTVLADVAAADVGDPIQSDLFHVDIANPQGDTIFIQVVDGANNVGVYSAKGAGLRLFGVTLTAEPTFFDDSPSSAGIQLTATIDSDDVASLVGPVTYVWDFGDGSTETTTGPVALHKFSGLPSFTVNVQVRDSNGGIGAASVTVYNVCQDAPGDTGIPADVTISAGQADFVGCGVSHTGTPQNNGTITITLSTAAALTTATSPWPPKIRYTVNLSIGKGGAKNLSYREGSFSGLKSLQVTLNGNFISFTFDQKDIGWAPGSTLTWFADTQGGVEGTQGAGSLDHFDQQTYTGQ